MKNAIFLAFFTLGLFGCSSVLKEFPVRRFFIADLVNYVCAEYEVIDAQTLKFRLVAEHQLLASGLCDRMVGFNRDDFATAKNWIRDAIAAGKTCK